MLEFERKLWAEGYPRLAGVDEAGRGPLAGPVVAAAVVFTREFLEAHEHDTLATLTDSKKLTATQREHFFDLLITSPSVEIGIGFGDVAEIDAINILRSTHRTMSRALLNLPNIPDYALIDGLPVPGMPCPSTAIIKGDGRSLSIAAASVIAKVTRDQWMRELDLKYPAYGFKQHKGYGTAAHIQALLKHGATVYHRKTFQPIRDIEDIRARKALADEASHVATD